MFDERNPIWIKIYKTVVILSAIAILIAGFIWAKEEATWYSSWSGKANFEFGEFIVYFAISAAVAAIELAAGMLSVNFLNNVQIIREKLEEKL